MRVDLSDSDYLSRMDGSCPDLMAEQGSGCHGPFITAKDENSAVVDLVSRHAAWMDATRHSANL